jgi:hypothetical protein
VDAPDTDGQGESDTPATACPDEFETYSLGTFTLGADGRSEPIEIEVDECAQSMTLVAQGRDDVTFLAYQLTSPEGDEVITTEVPPEINPLVAALMGPWAAQMFSPNRTQPSEGAFATLVSNNPEGVTLTPGTWTVVLEGGALNASTGAQTPYADGAVELEVIFKNVDTQPEGGTLDLNLYFTGASDLTADTAQTDEMFQAALDKLRETYGAAGVTIDEVRYFDIDEYYQTINSIFGRNNDLVGLFKQGAGDPEGLSFFFVERFEVELIPGMDGGAVGGVSGGIPGPPSHPGSARGGVAVSLAAAEDFQNSEGDTIADNLAHIMGHEGGHYLGLFHVVEFIPGIEDYLSDTASGTNATNNLMYPTVGGNSTLSPLQVRVIHNNPMVQP